MKIVKKNQTIRFKNSDVCTALEYPLGDPDVNGAVIELNGRYPDKGRVVNLECKEIAFIIKGSGKLAVENKEVLLHEGDLAFIEPKERYYLDGIMTLFISCAPAWKPEQHKEIT